MMSKETVNLNQEKVKQKKPKKKYGCLKGVLIFILVLLLLGGAVYGAAHVMLSRINREELEDLNVSQEVLDLKKGMGGMNIALFGVDSRDDAYTNTRSDAMMVFSFNSKTNQAYLTSVVRDTFAYINEDHGFEKINHAYAYGGPTLAVQAINQNFDLDIQKYVTVNFNAVEYIINKLGGVEVDVQDYELQELNRVIAEMNVEVSGEEANLLEGTGLQTLNGRQAVAYMRIRKVGNGDYERMERQRRVITLVAQKAFSYNKVKLLGLMNDFLPYIQTNLTTNEIIALGTQLLLSGEREIEQVQLPQTELSYGEKLSDGLYYLVPTTLEENVIEWHDKVYGTDRYTPTSGVMNINQKIINYTGLY